MSMKVRALIFATIILFSGTAQAQHTRAAHNVQPNYNHYNWRPYYNGTNRISPGYYYNQKTGRSSVSYGPSTFSYLPGYVTPFGNYYNNTTINVYNYYD